MVNENSTEKSANEVVMLTAEKTRWEADKLKQRIWEVERDTTSIEIANKAREIHAEIDDVAQGARVTRLFMNYIACRVSVLVCDAQEQNAGIVCPCEGHTDSVA